MAAEMQGALAAAVGVGATVELTPTGAMGSEPRMVVPAGKGGAQIAQQLQPFLLDILTSLFPRFPKEAVGPGAKWQASTKQPTATITQTFTLKGFEGVAGVITSELSAAGPKQPLEVRGAPPGAMVSSKSEGKAEYVFALDRAPAKFTSESTSGQTIEAGGKTQTMGARTKVTLGN